MLPDKDRSRAPAQLCLQWGGLRVACTGPPTPRSISFLLFSLGSEEDG